MDSHRCGPRAKLSAFYNKISGMHFCWNTDNFRMGYCWLHQAQHKAGLIHSFFLLLSRICFSQSHPFPGRKSWKPDDSVTSDSRVPGESCSFSLKSHCWPCSCLWHPGCVWTACSNAHPRTYPKFFWIEAGWYLTWYVFLFLAVQIRLHTTSSALDPVQPWWISGTLGLSCGTI